MPRLVVLAAIAALLAGPVPAQSLSVLLPSLTYPATITTTSTKDCVPTATIACPPLH
jgi:hypothetical protein